LKLKKVACLIQGEDEHFAKEKEKKKRQQD
jgi:hypothetical protein